MKLSFPLAVWQAMLAGVYIADKIHQGDFDFVPTSRIAEDLDIPAPSLSRLLRSLNRAGLVETREGSRGGVRLAVSPDRITLLDIVIAIEREVPLFRTDTTPTVTGDTPTRRQRALRDALDQAERAMRASLEEVTIESITST